MKFPKNSIWVFLILALLSLSSVLAQEQNFTPPSPPPSPGYQGQTFSDLKASAEPIFADDFQKEKKIVTSGQTLGFSFLIVSIAGYPVELSSPELSVHIKSPSEEYRYNLNFSPRTILPNATEKFDMIPFLFKNSSRPAAVPEDYGQWIITESFTTTVNSIKNDSGKLIVGDRIGFFPFTRKDTLQNKLREEFDRDRIGFIEERHGQERDARGWLITIIGLISGIIGTVHSFLKGQQLWERILWLSLLIVAIGSLLYFVL